MINIFVFLTLLFTLSLCDNKYDVIIGINNYFQVVPGTTSMCEDFSECHEYIQELLSGEHGVVTYATVMLNYDSCLCNNTNNTLNAKMIVVGASKVFSPINGTANICSSFSECLTLGCNIKHKDVTNFFLTGRL